MVDRLYVLVKGKKVEAVSIRTALEFLKVPFNIFCSNMHWLVSWYYECIHFLSSKIKLKKIRNLLRQKLSVKVRQETVSGIAINALLLSVGGSCGA